MGIGVNLFELSIGLWIATEVIVKFPNIYGRVGSGFAVLVIQQLFGNPVINALQNFQDNWEMLLYFAPALIPNLKSTTTKNTHLGFSWVLLLSLEPLLSGELEYQIIPGVILIRGCKLIWFGI